MALVTAGSLGAAAAAKSRQDPPEINVLLDADITVSMRGAVRPRHLDADAFRLRTDDGRQWRGSLVLGSFLFDQDTQRRVVVRPEAVREFYQLVRGMDREAAQRKTDRLLAAVERTGRHAKLRNVDRGLTNELGPSYGAGTRLDAANVFAVYPSTPGAPGGEFAAYRRLVAGDDALWQIHMNGDPRAYPELSVDDSFERFFHPIDQETGVPAADSVLRSREHRRVLMRRSRRAITFVPDVPIREDLGDLSLLPGDSVRVEIRKPLVGARFLKTGLGGDRAAFRFGPPILHLPLDQPAFGAPDARVGAGEARPRVVNVTPPNGERYVDPTTDWEDPDNSFSVPPPARRTFTVRLRFAQPLDPRTVNATTFSITKVVVAPDSPDELVVNDPVEIGVYLAQTRLGEVRVDLTPALDLDPDARYEIVVRGPVRGLGGRLLDLDYVSTFQTR